ncbi:MAG: hypothetical protein RLZZ360_876 [Candidatus Parcubacteria bacterium]
MKRVDVCTTAAAIAAAVRSRLSGEGDEVAVIVVVDDGSSFLQPPDQEVHALRAFTSGLGLLVPDLDPAAGLSFGVIRQPLLVEVDTVAQLGVSEIFFGSHKVVEMPLPDLEPPKLEPFWQRLNTPPASATRRQGRGPRVKNGKIV